MLTERINEHLRELSETDRSIWRYIDANRTAASRASIHELATRMCCLECIGRALCTEARL